MSDYRVRAVTTSHGEILDHDIGDLGTLKVAHTGDRMIPDSDKWVRWFAGRGRASTLGDLEKTSFSAFASVLTLKHGYSSRESVKCYTAGHFKKIKINGSVHVWKGSQRGELFK